jgi:hypothetical protein
MERQSLIYMTVPLGQVHSVNTVAERVEGTIEKNSWTLTRSYSCANNTGVTYVNGTFNDTSWKEGVKLSLHICINIKKYVRTCRKHHGEEPSIHNLESGQRLVVTVIKRLGALSKETTVNDAGCSTEQ